eukprot:s397_g28.t1
MERLPTAYSRRWNREYNGSLCMFGELIDAKVSVSGRVRDPKAGSQWFSGVYLGKDTEADEVVLGNANGVFKSTAFVMPPDLGVKGRVRPPPGLERVEEEEVEGNVELEDMVPGRSESVTEQDLLLQDGNDRAPAEMDHEAPEATGSLKIWYLVGVRVSLSRTYCFKMAMIELLLKWIMKHLRQLENRQERVRGLIQMHVRLSRQLSK